METITVEVYVRQMEPGSHFCKKSIGTVSTKEYELPKAECSETRPDWGVYHPIVTHPAIERALRARGAFPIILPADQQYFFGVKK